MKYLTLIFLGTLFILVNASAQEPIFTLHPVVGDTIDAEEISRYMLFQNYEFDDVDYLILTKRDSIYNVNGYSKSTKVIDERIKKEEVEFQKENIEKLNKYFSSIPENDSVDVINIYSVDSISLPEINLDIMTPELLKDIKREYRWKRWAEYRKEVEKNREKGMVY